MRFRFYSYRPLSIWERARFTLIRLLLRRDGIIANVGWQQEIRPVVRRGRGLLEHSDEPERVAVRFDGHADPAAMYGRKAMYKGEVEYVRADLHQGAVRHIETALKQLGTVRGQGKTDGELIARARLHLRDALASTRGQ